MIIIQFEASETKSNIESKCIYNQYSFPEYMYSS